MTQMNLKAVKGIQIMKFREQLNMGYEGRSLKGDFQGSGTSESVGGGTIINSERQRGYRPASHSTKLHRSRILGLPSVRTSSRIFHNGHIFFPSNHTDFLPYPGMLSLELNT